MLHPSVMGVLQRQTRRLEFSGLSARQYYIVTHLIYDIL